MLDYIVVGAGLAGIAFAETLSKNDRKFIVFDNGSRNSSSIAAGLYNPVILKRFSGMANAQEHLDQMKLCYDSIEHRLHTQLNFPTPILRRFYSVEEQNNWFVASDKPKLSGFLSNEVIQTSYRGISSPFGFGKVLQTGWVDTAKLLQRYSSYLKSTDRYCAEAFEYTALSLSENHVTYKGLSARHIVFAEGFGLHQNPWFNFLPLDGTKGELLIIEAPLLNLNIIINSSIFILPLGNNHFKVGATYNWDDKDEIPTIQGKEELIEKMAEVITCDYKIVAHKAGVRPTVKDRKPLIGTHHNRNMLHVLNGLGTRGVMLGPSMAQLLYDHIEYKKTIPKDLDIKRFKSF